MGKRDNEVLVPEGGQKDKRRGRKECRWKELLIYGGFVGLWGISIEIVHGF